MASPIKFTASLSDSDALRPEALADVQAVHHLAGAVLVLCCFMMLRSQISWAARDLRPRKDSESGEFMRCG